MQIAETVIQSRLLADEVGQRGGPRRFRPARPWETDRAARDRAYSPSSCVPNLDPYLRRYADRSARARDQLSWLALRYGPERPELLHFFRAPDRPAPVRHLRPGLPPLVEPARNHFDLPFGLSEPHDPAGRAVLGQMKLGTRRSGVR
jgi:hypothetical protein